MALRAAKKAAKQWRDGETLVPNAPRYSLGFRSKTVKCRADDALQRTPGMQHCLFFRNHNYGQAHLPGGLLFPRGAAFLSEGLAWYTGINYGGLVNALPVYQPDFSTFTEKDSEWLVSY